MKLEPFNLKAEREEGYFDEDGGYVYKKKGAGQAARTAKHPGLPAPCCSWRGSAVRLWHNTVVHVLPSSPACAPEGEDEEKDAWLGSEEAKVGLALPARHSSPAGAGCKSCWGQRPAGPAAAGSRGELSKRACLPRRRLHGGVVAGGER